MDDHRLADLSHRFAGRDCDTLAGAAAVKRMILWMVVPLLIAIALWLWKGRMLTLAVDRVLPVPVRQLPVSPITFRGSEFLIGGESLTITMLNNENAPLTVATDTQHRIVLSMGRDAIVLGPRTNPVNPNGPLIVDFEADPEDQVQLTARESLLPWPNFFELGWGASTPRWKKYFYYRLVWTKPSGARLEMRWRYEREYYERTGWTGPLMKYNFQCGLQSLEILPESKGPEGAVVRYIARTKGWSRNQYWLERRGVSKDGQNEMFAVIHLCERCLSEPGGGGSVEVWVDRAKQEVVKELGYQ